MSESWFENMRIIIHCDEYTPRHVPSAIRMQVFATVFQRLGNQVTVLAGNNSLDGGSKRAKEAVYCPTIPLKKKTPLNRLANQLSFGFSSCIKSCFVGKADIVITTSPPALVSIFGWMIAKLKGAKLIYDVRDIWPDVGVEMGSFSKNGFYYKAFSFIANFMFRQADLVTTVSEGKVAKIKAKLPNSMQSKVLLVGNGIDENFVKQKANSEVIKKYDLNSKFTCIYVGNVGLAQGLAHLLDLAESVDKDKYQFLIFGKGAEKEMLEKEAEKRNLTHVRFCGTVDENTVYSLLNYSAMTYIPLVNSNLKDSIPTKTYEALGAACPIFMVADGDATKLVYDSGLGMVLSPDNIEDLTRVFRIFVRDYSFIKSKRENAIRYVLENHSRQKIARQFEKELHKLVD